MSPTLRRFAALGLVLALVTAACGDDADDAASTTTTEDDGSSPDPTSDDTTTTTTTTPTVVEARPSAGCEGELPPPGLTDETLGERTYIRSVPPGVDGPVPLVVDIHGYQEGSTVHVQMAMLPAFGDANGFAVILPHGRGTPVQWAVGVDSPDVDFIDELLDEAERTMCIDTARVYVTGLSNGAGMTSTLACTLADRFAAAAPVAGVIDPPGCAPSRPVPVVTFHGTEDPFLLYEGGLGPAGLALPAPDGSDRTFADIGGDPRILVEGPSRPEIVQAWASRNGCGADTSSTTIGDDVELDVWDCPPGADVELYTIVGGGHTWPSSEFAANLGQIMGPTTTTIDANEVMWEFFQRHALAPSVR